VAGGIAVSSAIPVAQPVNLSKHSRPQRVIEFDLPFKLGRYSAGGMHTPIQQPAISISDHVFGEDQEKVAKRVLQGREKNIDMMEPATRFYLAEEYRKTTSNKTMGSRVY
jgi:hypothetical protein